MWLLQQSINVFQQHVANLALQPPVAPSPQVHQSLQQQQFQEGNQGAGGDQYSPGDRTTPAEMGEMEEELQTEGNSKYNNLPIQSNSMTTGIIVGAMVMTLNMTTTAKNATIPSQGIATWRQNRILWVD